METKDFSLDIQNLRFSYGAKTSSTTWTLEVPSLRIAHSDLIVMNGDNMSGKSTLLKLIAGLIGADAERKSFKLNNVLLHDWEKIRRRSILLSSNDVMLPDLSVSDNILLALSSSETRIRDLVLEKSKRLLRDAKALPDFVMSELLGSLSSGGQALVKLCRSFDPNVNIVLIDEISSVLDEHRAKFFLEQVLLLRESGKAVVLVSHNERDRKFLTTEGLARNYYVRRDDKQSRLEVLT